MRGTFIDLLEIVAIEIPPQRRRELPNIGAILLPPLQEPVPESAAAQYSVASALARCASATNFDPICLDWDQLSAEFRILCVRDSTLHQTGSRCTALHEARR